MLLLSSSAALAATLALPAGAPPADWTVPARLAGFTLAAPGEAADVVCLAEGDGWWIRVEGVDGTVRAERLAAPRSAQAREDTAWLASSLLAEVVAEAGQVRAVVPSAVPPARGATVARTAADTKERPAPAPAKPAPPKAPPVVAPPRPPRPEPEPFPPEPPVAAPVATVGERSPPPPRAEAPLPSPIEVHPWVEAGGGLVARERLSTAPALHLGAGAVLADQAWLGLRLELPAERGIKDSAGTLRAADLRVHGAWSPPGRVASVLALETGLSLGTWRDSGEPLHSRLVAVLGGAAGLAVRLSPALSVHATGRVAFELADTEVQIGDEEPWTLSPWQGGASLSLRARIP